MCGLIETDELYAGTNTHTDLFEDGQIDRQAHDLFYYDTFAGRVKLAACGIKALAIGLQPSDLCQLEYL